MKLRPTITEFTPEQAYNCTYLADTPEAKKIWADAVNEAIEGGEDDATAIAIGNGAVADFKASNRLLPVEASRRCFNPPFADEPPMRRSLESAEQTRQCFNLPPGVAGAANALDRIKRQVIHRMIQRHLRIYGGGG